MQRSKQRYYRGRTSAILRAMKRRWRRSGKRAATWAPTAYPWGAATW